MGKGFPPEIYMFGSRISEKQTMAGLFNSQLQSSGRFPRWTTKARQTGANSRASVKTTLSEIQTIRVLSLCQMH